MRRAFVLVCLALVGGASRASAAPSAPPAAGVCAGVPEAESLLAVLISKDDVIRVEPLRFPERADDPTVPAGDGARVVLAAQPFVTAAWLQQAIRCHLAHRAAAASPPSDDRSPLDVPGAHVFVNARPGELLVNITSADRAVAKEILARSLALAPRPAAISPLSSRSRPCGTSAGRCRTS